jgi:hypothetical protein
MAGNSGITRRQLLNRGFTYGAYGAAIGIAPRFIRPAWAQEGSRPA